MWPVSMTISPPEVSRWASMVPSPKGTSVTIWFIFTAWAGAAVLPAYSSRIALAASIHSSDRNGYCATAAYLQLGVRWASGTVAPRLHHACRNLGRAADLGV